MGKYKQYEKDGKVIVSTEKAFKVVYKNLGYEPYTEVAEEPAAEVSEENGEETVEETDTETVEETDEQEEKTDAEMEEEIKEGLEELNVDELKRMAKKEKITGYSSMLKAELIEALV